MRDIRVRSTSKGVPQLEAGLQSQLGAQLRRIYDEVLSEPIPDRFRTLIDALDDTEGNGADSDTSTRSRTPSARSEFGGDAR